MKKALLCVWAGTMILAYMVGRLHEQEDGIKDYQAACVLNDCCRNMVDNIGTDAEEIYGEYMSNLDCDPKLVISTEDIQEYRWRY